MKARSIALAAAALLATAATSAAAQNYTSPHAPVISATTGAAGFPSEGVCHHIALTCARQAYVAKGPRASLPLFQTAARRGSPVAMRSIGLIVLHGEGGVAADPAEAMGWFYEAARRNDATSMFVLARAFEQGIGVGRDPALARFWLEQAARHDNAEARHALAQQQ